MNVAYWCIHENHTEHRGHAPPASRQTHRGFGKNLTGPDGARSAHRTGECPPSGSARRHREAAVADSEKARRPSGVTLVDTSVWVDHLRAGNRTLVSLLHDAEVLTHPFVIGELACGQIRN